MELVKKDNWNIATLQRIKKEINFLCGLFPDDNKLKHVKEVINNMMDMLNTSNE